MASVEATMTDKWRYFGWGIGAGYLLACSVMLFALVAKSWECGQ